MGNCVRTSFSNKHGDWERSFLSGDSRGEIRKRVGDRFSSLDGKKPMTTEVKIKISKKQLEELLGAKEMHGLTLEQVLNRLMNGGDEVVRSDQRSWRPALQSIPE
ncbi:hypothetical protein QVD17_38645 [Tagetes erecta]|uniref:Uncharacterized protein n=1 Tax=Tagetes erecta TaxID=13708 RepID=A0AAD8JSI0_TARER|nr:hypothetical protein QVD17_38645 [Tagetes erecta]